MGSLQTCKHVSEEAETPGAQRQTHRRTRETQRFRGLQREEEEEAEDEEEEEGEKEDREVDD